MGYIKVPISYTKSNPSEIKREIEDRTAMIDNLIELIVFTPRGSFPADPDFGFEYWNNEYANVNFRDFNNGQNGALVNGLYNEITRRECQDSIKRSLETYDVLLKQIDVSIELHSVDSEQRKKIASKFQVVVKVTGMLEEGLGTFTPYKKEISFLMEPTVKRYKI